MNEREKHSLLEYLSEEETRSTLALQILVVGFIVLFGLMGVSYLLLTM